METNVKGEVREGSHPGTIAYELEGSLYLNITRGCTARCLFCYREEAPHIGPYNLELTRDPTLEEFRVVLAHAEQYRQIVFCGFGEPTLRLELLDTIGRQLKARELSVRLNTNGHGNLIHKRSIVPELAGYLSAVSISLNAHNEALYNELCRPSFGRASFGAVLDFARECIGSIPEVTLTVVEHPQVDLEACRKLAAEIGVPLRVRRYYTHIRGTQRYLDPTSE
jgi:TatD family-associated radical SAM protein